jgi:mitochondrial fusion and transport protein UGO1
VLPTVLHSLVHPFLTLSTPLVLRSRFLIDSTLSPMTFSVARFCSSFVALFIKLPLETVLRRGQVAVLASQPYVRAVAAAATAAAREPRLETIVPVGPYRGVLGTMYHIVREEGSHAVAKPAGSPTGKAKAAARGKVKVAETVYKKGQGLEGLWRGFGVSWWGLVGLWTAGVLGNAGDGEF